MNMTSSPRRPRRSTPKGEVAPRRRRAFDMSGERAALLARNARRGDASSSSSPVPSAFGALFGAEATASTRDADVERGDDARVVSTDANVFERGDDAEDDGGDEDDDGVMADGSVSDSRGRRRRGWPAWLALGTIALGGATARARATIRGGERTVTASLGDAGGRDIAPSWLRPTGVALNGWLHLEEWFFANGETTIVDSPLGAKQGRVLPPFFNSTEGLGFEWSSEGDLVAQLAKRYGNARTVKIMNAYRSSWLTKQDLARLREIGFESLRIPVTWATFLGSERQPSRVIADPVYDDRALVSVDQMALTNVFRIIHRETGARVVIDMHSMPGGSSQGTYNGVFPHPPAFWNEGNEKVRELGLQSLHRMFKWYNSLRESDKNFVEGFTLLNEPAHLLPAKKDVMLEWMGKAIYAYRHVVARRREHKGLRVPRLYVNLIDTSGVRVTEFGDLMRKWFDREELRQWAVLDTHFYLAWGMNGCAEGCAWSCRDTTQQISERTRAALAGQLGALKRTAGTQGVHNFAVGEWSLATHHDSAKGCDNPRVKEAVYRGQLRALNVTDTPSFFWGWKMPNAGKHEAFWSMDHFQTERTAYLGALNGNVPKKEGETPQKRHHTRDAAELGRAYEEPWKDAETSATTQVAEATPVASATTQTGEATPVANATAQVAEATPVASATAQVGEATPVASTTAHVAEATAVNSSGELGFEGILPPWEKHGNGLPPVDFTPESQKAARHRKHAAGGGGAGGHVGGDDDAIIGKYVKGLPKDSQPRDDDAETRESEDEDVETHASPSHSDGNEQSAVGDDKVNAAAPGSDAEPLAPRRAASAPTYSQPQRLPPKPYGQQAPQQPYAQQQRQPYAQPVRQPAQQPVQQPARQSASQPAQRPAQLPAQQPAQQPAAGVPTTLAPARAAVVQRLPPATQAAAAAAPSAAPIVYAKDRHDGSFWGTAYGLDALKGTEVHQNALMSDDSAPVNEAEYYEEPREAVAARTGTPLPTYADDAVDHLHQHRNTYSMHDAKHMKHKISYDLFSADGSSKSRGKRDDGSNVESAGASTRRKSKTKRDDGRVDFDSLVESQNFEKKKGAKKAARVTEESVEKVPKKSRRRASSSASTSSKSGSVNDFFNDGGSGATTKTKTKTPSKKSKKTTKEKFDVKSIEDSFNSELGTDETADDDDSAVSASSSPTSDVPDWVNMFHAADA